MKSAPSWQHNLHHDVPPKHYVYGDILLPSEDRFGRDKAPARIKHTLGMLAHRLPRDSQQPERTEQSVLREIYEQLRLMGYKPTRLTGLIRGQHRVRRRDVDIIHEALINLYGPSISEPPFDLSYNSLWYQLHLERILALKHALEVAYDNAHAQESKLFALDQAARARGTADRQAQGRAQKTP